MFGVNDTVAYSSNGICRITEIRKQKSGKNMVEFFVLKPVYNEGSTIFVPVNNQVLTSRMRRTLSREEVMDLISGLPAAGELWPENESERQASFKAILQSGNQENILRIIKSLHCHARRCTAAGRKFRVSDERILKEAENILYEEFAYALGISKDQVALLVQNELPV